MDKMPLGRKVNGRYYGGSNAPMLGRDRDDTKASWDQVGMTNTRCS